MACNSTQIAQHSDPQFVITVRDACGNLTTTDLTALNDIEIKVAEESALTTNLISVLKSVSSARFSIDNTAKTITFNLLQTDSASVTPTIGSYAMTIWLKDSNNLYSADPLVIHFDVIPSVNHS